MGDKPVVSQVLGRVTEAARMFGEEGLTFDDWQLPIDDPYTRRDIVRFWQSGYAPTYSQREIESTMGTHFLGPYQVHQWLGVRYTPRQLETLGEIPFGLDLITRVKNTHVLVAGYPIDVWDMSDHETRQRYDGSYSPKKGNHLPAYLRTSVPLRWYLVPRVPVYVFGHARDYRDDGGNACYLEFLQQMVSERVLEIWEAMYIRKLFESTYSRISTRTKFVDYSLFTASTDGEGRHLVLDELYGHMTTMRESAPFVDVALGYSLI